MAGEVEVTDHLVVEVLGAGAVQPRVVTAPPGAELSTASGQLTDELGDERVLRVAPATAEARSIMAE